MKTNAWIMAKCAGVLVLALGLSNSAYGQAVGANASISGSVQDSTGAVIPNADIEIENINTGAKRTTVSNAVGAYSLAEVPLGTYKLTASAEGFADTIVLPIELQIKARVDLTVTLNPGTVVETVEVTGAAIRLESQTSDLGQVVTHKSVSQLPTRLRNPMELVTIAPGITNSFINGTGGGYYGANQDGRGGLEIWSTANFSIAGGHRANAVITVDGIDVRTDSGGGGNQPIVFSPDFIEEFKVQTNNYSAEFGSGAGVVNMVTKSGTNDLHGSIYDYLQNDNLNANTFFNNQRGLTRPELKRNQFGFVVGGPVYIPGVYDGRNKTWFIADWEKLEQRGPASSFLRMPTNAEEQGDFSGTFGANANEVVIYNPFDTFTNASGKVLRRPFANNQIPAGMRDSSGFVDNLIPFWPEPNRAGGEIVNGLPTQAGNWVKNTGSKFDYSRRNVKLDQQFGNKHRVSWRWAYNRLFQPNVDLYGNIASPFFSGATDQPRYEWSASHTWTVTPALVVNQAFYIQSQSGDTPNPSAGFDPTQLGGPFADGSIAALATKFNAGTSFPVIAFQGQSGSTGASANYAQLGAGVGRSGDNRKVTYALGFSNIRGNHELKWGTQLRPRYTDGNGCNDVNVTGRYQFGGFTSGPDPISPSVDTGNGFADLTLGLVGGGNFTNMFCNAATNGMYAWYFEDAFRVTRRLTLNLGVRYDFAQPGLGKDNQNVKFDPFIQNPLGEQSGPNTDGKTLNQWFQDNYGHPLLGGFVFAGTHGYGGRLTDTDFSNLAPRLGAAFKLNDKTVLRGGVAKLYWMTTYRALFSPSTNPFSARTDITGTIDGINPILDISNPFPGGINEPVGAANDLLTDVGKNLSGGVGGQKNPYSWQWNFGIQRELPANSLITISYVGSFARRLPCPFFMCSMQLGEETLRSQGARLVETVPNPFFGIITDPTAGALNGESVQRGQLFQAWPHFAGGALYIPPPAANSEFGLWTEEYPFKNNYQGYQVGFEKRYSDGLQANVALTAGKNLTTADSFEAGYLGPIAGYQNARDLTQEKSLSSEDTSYRLAISHVYDLPVGRGYRLGTSWHPALDAIAGGWQVSGIWTFQSGFPLPIGASPNNTNNRGFTNSRIFGARPDLVSDPQVTTGSRGQRIEQWIQPGAFKTVAPFTYGDAPRLLNGVRGDGIKNFDLSLIKHFRIREQMNVEFRAEMFNIFNRPQFAIPDIKFGSATFGRITSTVGPPRYMQMALKFNF
jgi:hypothetical protein